MLETLIQVKLQGSPAETWAIKFTWSVPWAENQTLARCGLRALVILATPVNLLLRAKTRSDRKLENYRAERKHPLLRPLPLLLLCEWVWFASHVNMEVGVSSYSNSVSGGGGALGCVKYSSPTVPLTSLSVRSPYWSNRQVNDLIYQVSGSQISEPFPLPLTFTWHQLSR